MQMTVKSRVAKLEARQGLSADALEWVNPLPGESYEHAKQRQCDELGIPCFSDEAFQRIGEVPVIKPPIGLEERQE